MRLQRQLRADRAIDGCQIDQIKPADASAQAQLRDRRDLIRHSPALPPLQRDQRLRRIDLGDLARERNDLDAIEDAASLLTTTAGRVLRI